MFGSEVCRMPNNYCPECDKDFKSLTGLNGHNQWKHNKVPEHLVSNSPTGKTNEMLELLSDRIEDLQMQVRSLGAGNNRSENGNGNGNGNGNDNGNDNGNSNTNSQPVGHYACLNCHNKGNHAPLQPGEPTCPKCGGKNNWQVALV